MRIKKISGRGRKREARRWIAYHQRLTANLFPVRLRSLLTFRDYLRVRASDPALAAAISEVLDDQFRKNAKLTLQQRRDQMNRRVERLRRERRRAARLANAALRRD